LGQLSGAAATVVRTTATVVTVVRATVVAVVVAVVGAAVVVGASVVLVVVVDVLVVVVLLVVVLEMVVGMELTVELEDVDSSIVGGWASTGGCSVNGAVTKPTANRLPKTPSGICAHIGQRRKAAQNDLAEATVKPPPCMPPERDRCPRRA
jgi:hypothetical protein